MTSVTTPMLAEKKCSKCEEVKPLSLFYQDRAKADGRMTWCRDCSLESVKASQARMREEIGEEAWREYVRRNVARHRASGRSKDDLQQAAWRAASRRLREMYPEAWEGFYREERYDRGLPV